MSAGNVDVVQHGRRALERTRVRVDDGTDHRHDDGGAGAMTGHVRYDEPLEFADLDSVRLGGDEREVAVYTVV